MKKILVFAALVLVLSGCQYGLFQRKDVMQIPEVNIGTQGVELFFAQNTPPHEVYEGNQFALLVNLANLGTTDVEEGIYALSYEPQYLYLPRQQAQGRFNVRGKSIFNPQGEERLLKFNFDTKPLGPQLQGYPATITFTACYPYKTNALITACIDTDLTGKASGKVCVPTPQAFPQGQGAPVAVATVETKMLPHKQENRVRPEFVLTIKNLGRGEIVAQELYREACSGRALGPEAWNVVTVEAMLSDTPLTCAPTLVKIKQQGETKVVCTIPEGIDSRLGSYTAPLTITLGYGYISSIGTQTKIIKP
ncbi:MAG: membrane lipoprotein lipid attachment site-containing protein [Candidatus Woesearchaeota archaeon]